MTDVVRVAALRTASPTVNLPARSKQIKNSQPNGNPAVTTTYYAGAQEADINNGQVTVKTYWPYGLGVEIDQPGSSTSELNWSHHDRLGSIISISDSSGNLKEKLAYDSWGKRRTTDGSATPDSIDGQTDNKGYTGHEMLDQLDLVHMNGRIYDPLMARFLSADPMIQDPAHSQSYNRYTYVWNNPTNLTDPTGFVAADTGDLLSDTLTFLKSGLGFTESKSEPANEKPKTTGSADNSGGQGKSSQTVTVTGSLAQARAEQWLFAKTIEAAYGVRDYAVRIAPVVRTAAFRAAPRAFAAQAFHEVPVVGQAIGIAGGTYFLYSVGKAIFHAGDGKSDTSAEEALSGASSGDKPNLLDDKGEIHVLDGDATGGGHRPGTGKPGKSEFPSNWSDDKIKGEISDVATDPNSTRTPGRGGEPSFKVRAMVLTLL